MRQKPLKFETKAAWYGCCKEPVIKTNKRQIMKVTGRVPTTMGPRTIVAQGMTEDMADIMAYLVRRSGGAAVVERDGPRVVFEEWRARQRAQEKRAQTLAIKKQQTKPAIRQPEFPRLSIVRSM
jgi:hypothetical protein